MIYIKYFENNNSIDSTCKIYGIKKYTINPDGSIDVDDNVYLHNENLTKIPIKFRNVTGNFICSFNQLTSLKGAPNKVNNFNCTYNQLISLEGCPINIDGYFDCYNNNLTNLSTLRSNIKGSIYITGNPLPEEILNNKKNIKEIIKWQEEFCIWNKDGSLNKENFQELLDNL